MKAIIKRELKNYLKNPILWIGTLFILFGIYQTLSPYLRLHYFESEQEVASLEPENILDADITEGYVKSTKEEQLAIACERTKEEMKEALGMSEAEVDQIFNDMRQKNMTMDEMTDYLWDNYDFYAKYGLEYYYTISEFHKGTMQEANDYIRKNLQSHSFSYYFARKFTDFCGLYMGFFSTILLAFLFIRDTKKDTYELLHTKQFLPGPMSAEKWLAVFLPWYLSGDF